MKSLPALPFDFSENGYPVSSFSMRTAVPDTALMRCLCKPNLDRWSLIDVG